MCMSLAVLKCVHRTFQIIPIPLDRMRDGWMPQFHFDYASTDIISHQFEWITLINKT